MEKHTMKNFILKVNGCIVVTTIVITINHPLGIIVGQRTQTFPKELKVTFPYSIKNTM